MQKTLKRIQNKVTFTKGGVHPKENKQLTDSGRFTKVPNPKELRIHMNQVLGKPADVKVEVKADVTAMQKIGETSGFISACVHTPLAGKIKKIEDRNLLGAQGTTIQIDVKADQDAFPDFEKSPPEPDLSKLTQKEIVEKVKEAGIVGMGGATFPTYVKLSPPPGTKIDTVLINGAECEPYLTSDECLMRNFPHQIIYGLLIILKALDAKYGFVVIEDNKPDAIKSMQDAASKYPNIKVVTAKTFYPQGGEKQLTDAALRRQIPLGGLPANAGVLIQNVGTTAAVYEAVQFERPLARRLLTVSGRAVRNPQNLLVPIGISGEELLNFCGGTKDEIAAIVFGGPMMGKTTNRIDTPVTKGTSGILFLTKDEIDSFKEETCIRCGTCVKVCPMCIVPNEIMKNTKFSQLDKISDANACIECGSCAYACPAHIRLTEWCRLAKYELRLAAMKKQKGAK